MVLDKCDSVGCPKTSLISLIDFSHNRDFVKKNNNKLLIFKWINVIDGEKLLYDRLHV